MTQKNSLPNALATPRPRALLPEQAVRRAGLDLPVSVVGRHRRRLRLARRSLHRRAAALPRAGRRDAGHHLDAGALSGRVERLLQQAQDQSDVAGHGVLQRGHLTRQLIDPGVDLLHRPTRAALKVAWKRTNVIRDATRRDSTRLDSTPSSSSGVWRCKCDGCSRDGVSDVKR